MDLSYFRRKSNPADAVLVDKDQPRPDSDPPYIDPRSLEGRHLIPRGEQRFDSRLLQERVERTSNYVD